MPGGQETKNVVSVSLLRSKQSDYIKKRADNQKVPFENIVNSFNAVQNLDELFIKGRNKLEIEIESAQNIPEDRRYLINKSYLEKLECHAIQGK